MMMMLIALAQEASSINFTSLSAVLKQEIKPRKFVVCAPPPSTTTTTTSATAESVSKV